MAMSMTQETRWMDKKRRVFHSVFQTHDATAQSTLFSTFLGTCPVPFNPSPVEPDASDQARYDRSRKIVTSCITLPDSLTAEDSFGSLPTNSQDIDADFREALRDVMQPGSRLPAAVLGRDAVDILSWHTQQVRLHFVNCVLPYLNACNLHSEHSEVLIGGIRTLEAAQRQYMYGLSLIMCEMEEPEVARVASQFLRELHAIVGSAPSTTLLDSLRRTMRDLMGAALGLSDGLAFKRGRNIEPSDKSNEATRELLQLVDTLKNIGLAGERFQILFAELLDDMMSLYVQMRFRGQWKSTKSRHGKETVAQVSCVRHLSDWIENRYCRLAVEVMSYLDNVQVSWTDVEKWKEVAVGKLAALRIEELFDMVVAWPNSEGGVDDLRYAVTTPQRRLQLTNSFSTALEKRLLHSGRSTLEILRTYISMIRTFQKLDHSRVLLDRVAYSLQLYLCTREDTVRIIVTSLLSTANEDKTEARKTKLIELAEMLHDPEQFRTERQDEEWDDHTWVPPPVDAGSNYRRRKSEDVIGTLIVALGSPEIFIKEFQNIIGQRLLSEQSSFEQEIVVLDLLKKRFGESSLQACDVMIRDIQDSRRLDGDINRSTTNHPSGVQSGWNLHAKILSRLFWPDMGDEPFVVPSQVANMQKTYEGVFEHLKPSRKLKWLNHLGQATVELELADRTIREQVHTYKATVIQAFGNDDNAPGDEHDSVSWSFEDLWQRLQIDEDLLTAALEFWEKKKVLRRLADERYQVIERLKDLESVATTSPSKTHQTHHSGTKSGPAGSGGGDPKGQMYWQFMVGMLTNTSSAMPLAQIAMMLKMLIPDGFPWSNEELQEFLTEKVAAGELELAGGKYRLVKK